MAALDLFRVELCSIVVHERAYQHESVKEKWDDLVRLCVVGYRIYFDKKSVGEAVGNAFSAVASMANFIGSGSDSGDIFFADNLTFTVRRSENGRSFIFSVNEDELQFDCDKSQLTAFFISMCGEIIQSAKQLGFDIGQHLSFHICQD